MADPTTPHPPGTVFLVAHQGFAARYLLRTDILTTLVDAGARVVILAPNADEPYFVEEFASDRVSIEPLRAGHWDSTSSRRWSLADHLRQFTIAHGDEAATMRAKLAHFEGRLRERRPITGRAFGLAVRALWRSRLLRRLLVGVETGALPRGAHQDLFDRHRPDLVVVTTLGYFQPDAVLLEEARRNGVRTAALVFAWDNPTSKGYRCGQPDFAVAWSERMAEQLVHFQDFPRERTFVGGVPHFDNYLREGALLDRVELFSRLGLDPDRRTVLFAARSPSTYGHNLLIAETLARAVAGDLFGEPAQLVVRPHPINFRPDIDAPIEGYHELLARYEHVHLDIPEVVSEKLFCDVAPSDNERFGSLLRHCDVLVNMFSTTTLEAFLLDRPVVNVAADAHVGAAGAERTDHGRVPEPRPFDEDTHVRAMVDAGAVRVARSMDELVSLTRAYLADPALDREGRALIAGEECGPLDGRSGERIGRHLLELLGGVAGEPAAEAVGAAR